MEDGQHIFLGIGDWTCKEPGPREIISCLWDLPVDLPVDLPKKKAAKGWAFEILGNSQNAALDDPLKDSMAGFEVCTPYLQRFSRAWVKVEYPNWT